MSTHETPGGAKEEINQPVLGVLASGEEVVDRPDSHLKNDPKFREVLRLALSKVSSEGRTFFRETIQFEKPVGTTSCVVTNPGDEIVYAQRPNRDGLTRFVVGREPEETTDFNVIILKKDGAHYLITAFAGPLGEKEPWDKGLTDPQEKQRAEKFWANHALVFDPETIVPGTQITEREYRESL